MTKPDKPASPKGRKAERIPILIVENDADHWLIIRSVLARCFPEVEPIWVNNAAQAVTYLQQASLSKRKMPWLILLELHLPRPKDGWSLLELLKANPGYQSIPVIVLSHSADDNDITKAYTQGVASYIVKPTTYHKWLVCMYSLRSYWWEVVTRLSPSIARVEQPVTAQPCPVL